MRLDKVKGGARESYTRDAFLTREMSKRETYAWRCEGEPKLTPFTEALKGLEGTLGTKRTQTKSTRSPEKTFGLKLKLDKGFKPASECQKNLTGQISM